MNDEEGVADDIKKGMEDTKEIIEKSSKNEVIQSDRDNMRNKSASEPSVSVEIQGNSSSAPAETDLKISASNSDSIQSKENGNEEKSVETLKEGTTKSQQRKGRNQRKSREEKEIYRPKPALEEEKKNVSLKKEEEKRGNNRNRRNQNSFVKKEEGAMDSRRKEGDSRRRGDNANRTPKDDMKRREDSERSSSTLYSMWQSREEKESAPQNRRRSSSRKNDILNRTPSEKDLNSMVLSHNSAFEENEIVLAPRTRGGFSYAKVLRPSTDRRCYFDHSVGHQSNLWKVIYMNNGSPLSKELPTIYLGKLPQGPSEDPKEEKNFESAEIVRRVGERPNRRDLDRVILSPHQSFNLDEIVLVPRSKGGFTYGKIYKESKSTCPLSVANPNEVHNIFGWKVAVSEPPESERKDDSGVIRKDLIAPLLGKVHFIINNEVAKPGKAISMSFEEPPFHPHLGFKKESESIDEEVEEYQERKRSFSIDEEDLDYGVYDDALDNAEETEDFMWAPNPITDSRLNFQSISSIASTPLPAENKEDVPVSLQSLIIGQNKESLPNKAPKTSANGGLIKVDNLFGKKDVGQGEKSHLVVIDGMNVAKTHGRDVKISSEGVQLAINYWLSRGQEVICFLPQQCISKKQANSSAPNSQVSNVPLILELIEKGNVILTPPNDGGDDSFIFDYAMKKNACIVSNESYLEYVIKEKSEKGKRNTKKWLKDHLISFTFVGDEFYPNPNFKFPSKKGKE